MTQVLPIRLFFSLLFRAGLLATVLAVLVPLFAIAQSGPQPSANSVVKLESVKVLPAYDGPLIEIITSAPAVPEIQKLDGPPRLVIDLPNTVVSWRHKRIPVRSTEIKAIRADQHQDSPPSARIVVDLRAAVPYTTEAIGNRLTIRLTPRETTPAAVAPKAAASDSAATPSSPSSAGVSFSGSRVPVGSSVSAGSDAAVLRLGRGGEVRVCPNTTVSVTYSSNGRDLLLGMSTGALEAHYSLQASADAVLTPDFRILLAGPGEFDYAISVDAHGNTCVRTLPGNTASAIVSELIGDGTYQVKPSEQVMFHSGRINEIDPKVPPTCGCAPPIAPITVAGPESRPLPALKPNDVHVSVDAPFVFNANAVPAASPATTQTGPSVLETETLPVRNAQRIVPLPYEIVPPLAPQPAGASAEPKGFLGKIRKFFGAIFR